MFRKFKRKDQKQQQYDAKNPKSNSLANAQSVKDSVQSSLEQSLLSDSIDTYYGFERLTSGGPHEGWLLNIQPGLIVDPENETPFSCLDLYFLRSDLSTFKISVVFYPYFFIQAQERYIRDIETELRRKFSSSILETSIVEKENLSLKNHLSGLKDRFIRIEFRTVQMLLFVRKQLDPIVRANKSRLESSKAYFSAKDDELEIERISTFLNYIDDIREYDVPYYVRVAIDKDIRVAQWYSVSFPIPNKPRLKVINEKTIRPDPRILAFDIETTKMPLKFPDPLSDQIMMISYMADKQGYLILNRDIVSEDSDDFEYTPAPEYPGLFHVFNEPDEKSLLNRFFSHIRELRPHIFVTFNGDFFDWPFVETRSKQNGIDMFKEIGVKLNKKDEYFSCRCAPHLDCFNWVQRDSYLPHGSQGLKAVTKAKLGYDPLEIDPEDMTRLAAEDPKRMAAYSVSDAVATYYLYLKYIHPFIFSLCTILSLHPPDVLRKGSGTLCENLLMIEAYRGNIIFPNKTITEGLKFYGNHLLDSETYVGGHVEALASGVFRSDIPLEYKLERKTLHSIIEDVDEIIKFVASRNKFEISTCKNHEEIKNDIVKKLLNLRDVGSSDQNSSVGFARRKERSIIVHLDVAAMYPNIILTNRLQPQAIVNEEICAACCHNKVENDCKRMMEWKWRGEIIPANRQEYNLIKTQIESEKVTVGSEKKHYFELPKQQQVELLKGRLKEYSRKVYKRMHQTVVVKKTETVCMRENSFYVETVRAFRDRRYVYKGLLKKWQIELDKVKKSIPLNETAIDECEKMIVMYDSMQLAHKCILNSFYGYVMRKGSRWQSMEMAGVVTRTGHRVIARARDVLSAIGIPLELDTDGVWTALPESFPANYRLEGPSKNVTFSFPCELLNRLTAISFSNHQYQTLVPPKDHIDSSISLYNEHSFFAKTTECSIEFEVDGPYKAMILPAAKEKGKRIKKRYAVFHLDGKLAELKGFEMKRRGELKLIKLFQSTVFSYFLHGTTLAEVYESVSTVARQFLTYLTTKGENMTDEEILDLLTESSNMSRSLSSYSGARTCQVTTAKRLVEFLGSAIAKSKGLKCAYIIANKPANSTVTERAIPIPIFSADYTTKTLFLTKWLKTPFDQHQNDLRTIIDWEYYMVRLESCIQKLITIPCELQGIPNPLPEVKQPDWLEKEAAMKRATDHQTSLSELFGKSTESSIDIESIADDLASQTTSSQKRQKTIVAKKRDRNRERFFSEKAPDMDKHFSRWLVFMKRYWRLLREERRRRRQERTEIGNKETQLTQIRKHVSVPRTVNLSLTDFFSRQERDLLFQDWHIVQIAETTTPGLFRLWAIVGKTITSISLTIPRTFYINSFIEFPNDKTLKRVHYFPPRSHPEMFLYQKTLSEVEFINSAASIASLSLGTEIEGVYETKTPLDFKAVFTIGAVCKLKPNVKKKSLSQLAFSIDDLVRQDNTSHYFESDNFDLLFLYHVHRGQEAVFGLYQLNCEDEVERRKVHIITVNPFPETNANVVKLVRERAPELEAILMRERTLTEGYSSLGRSLRTAHDEVRRPTFLIIQSDSSTVSSLLAVPALQDFPCICMPFNESDSSFGSEGISFFDRWQANAVTIMQKRSTEVTSWFESQIECARMANIPIGNFAEDYILTILDVLFARALTENNFLLWASNGLQPDLGGSLAESEIVEPLTPQEVINEGCFFDGISITFELNAVAIDAIIEANTITEVEGTTHLYSALLHNPLLDKDLSNSTQILKATSDSEVVRQFFLLRQLVNKWVQEVENSTFSDLLLAHLPRWINNSSSQMFDPALTHLIESFMKKVFMHLIMEFEKLGTRVIYGSYDRFIIQSNKKTLIEVQEYTQFLLNTIRKKPIFEFLAISPTQFWFPLVFLDRHNFSGVCFQKKNPEDLLIRVKGRRLEDDTDGELPKDCVLFADGERGKLLSSWNIADYLPETVRSLFLVLIGEYILNVKAFAEKEPQSLLSADTRNLSQVNEEDENALAIKQQNIAPKLLPNSMQEQMLTTVQHLHITQPTITSDLPMTSTSTRLTKPPLAYINFSIRILELDKRLSLTVRRLKRSLLSIINVNEFSPEAKFEYPCQSYIIPSFYCSYCNACQDLDLLRDSRLLARNWKCSFCRKPIDSSVVENLLCDVLDRFLLSFQKQDLICNNCHSVKNDNLSLNCTSCRAISFRLRVPQSKIADLLTTMNVIATYYSFDELKEKVDWFQV